MYIHFSQKSFGLSTVRFAVVALTRLFFFLEKDSLTNRPKNNSFFFGVFSKKAVIGTAASWQ